MNIIGKVGDRVLRMLVPAGKAAAADCQYQKECRSGCGQFGADWRRKVCYLGGGQVSYGPWQYYGCC